MMRFRISDPGAMKQKRKQSYGKDQETIEASLVPQVDEIYNEEEQIAENARHLATIMFTDMVGYTALGQEMRRFLSLYSRKAVNCFGQFSKKTRRNIREK